MGTEEAELINWIVPSREGCVSLPAFMLLAPMCWLKHCQCPVSRPPTPVSVQGSRRYGTEEAEPIDWIVPPREGVMGPPSLSEMFAYHATTMANTIRTSLIVFSRKVRLLLGCAGSKLRLGVCATAWLPAGAGADARRSHCSDLCMHVPAGGNKTTPHTLTASAAEVIAAQVAKVCQGLLPLPLHPDNTVLLALTAQLTHAELIASTQPAPDATHAVCRATCPPC